MIFNLSLVLLLACLVEGKSWMEFACEKSPNMELCKPKTAKNPPIITTKSDGTESTEDFLTKFACARQPDLELCKSEPIELLTTSGEILPIHVSLADADKDGDNSVVPGSDPASIPTVRTAYCVKYADHYSHYCNNVTSYDIELQKKLFKYCPVYMINCPPVVTTAVKIERESFVQPCVRGCRLPHCTRECICAHYVSQIKRECRHGAGAQVFKTSCTLWYRSCAHLYDIPHEWFNYGLSDKVPIHAQLVNNSH